MKFTRKQYIAVFVLLATFTLVSGLCYGTFASAQSAMPMANGVGAAMDMSHCGDEAVSAIAKNGPINNAVMPCCLDNHDNSTTTVPTTLKDRVNISALGAAEQVLENVSLVSKDNFIYSSASPPKPDILSSVCRLE